MEARVAIVVENIFCAVVHGSGLVLTSVVSTRPSSIIVKKLSIFLFLTLRLQSPGHRGVSSDLNIVQSVQRDFLCCNYTFSYSLMDSPQIPIVITGFGPNPSSTLVKAIISNTTHIQHYLNQQIQHHPTCHLRHICRRC